MARNLSVPQMLNALKRMSMDIKPLHEALLNDKALWKAGENVHAKDLENLMNGEIIQLAEFVALKGANGDSMKAAQDLIEHFYADIPPDNHGAIH